MLRNAREVFDKHIVKSENRSEPTHPQAMAINDNTDIQMTRIERVAKKLVPNANVLFDDNAPPGFIRFRIEVHSGAALAESDLTNASEIAQWSDEELRRCIRTLAAGKIL